MPSLMLGIRFRVRNKSSTIAPTCAGANGTGCSVDGRVEQMHPVFVQADDHQLLGQGAQLG